MHRYRGTRYNSRWDASTWCMIALTALCCFLPLVLDDDGYTPAIVGAVVLVSVIVILRSVFYKIDGDNLVVYQFFIPKAYPIAGIKEITTSHSWLSAPAASLAHRIAIRSVGSRMPLVISPVRQTEFVEQLLAVNQQIKVSLA